MTGVAGSLLGSGPNHNTLYAAEDPMADDKEDSDADIDMAECNSELSPDPISDEDEDTEDGSLQDDLEDGEARDYGYVSSSDEEDDLQGEQFAHDSGDEIVGGEGAYDDEDGDADEFAGFARP
ncbi:hypothetical protein BC628DRAFT_1341586 [Trametes gibbosa]|nr:hypothetical protein BC628DRAFT_1341586 [Trametes gibbosa]